MSDFQLKTRTNSPYAGTDAEKQLLQFWRERNWHGIMQLMAHDIATDSPQQDGIQGYVEDYAQALVYDKHLDELKAMSRQSARTAEDRMFRARREFGVSHDDIQRLLREALATAQPDAPGEGA